MSRSVPVIERVALAAFLFACGRPQGTYLEHTCRVSAEVTVASWPGERLLSFSAAHHPNTDDLAVAWNTESALFAATSPTYAVERLGDSCMGSIAAGIGSTAGTFLVACVHATVNDSAKREAQIFRLPESTPMQSYTLSQTGVVDGVSSFDETFVWLALHDGIAERSVRVSASDVVAREGVSWASQTTLGSMFVESAGAFANKRVLSISTHGRPPIRLEVRHMTPQPAILRIDDSNTDWISFRDRIRGHRRPMLTARPLTPSGASSALLPANLDSAGGVFACGRTASALPRVIAYAARTHSAQDNLVAVQAFEARNGQLLAYSGEEHLFRYGDHNDHPFGYCATNQRDAVVVYVSKTMSGQCEIRRAVVRCD